MPSVTCLGATSIRQFQSGLWAGGHFKATELAPYIIAQVLGAIVGAAGLYAIASGKAGFDMSAGFASNGYGEHSPGGYSLMAALTCEVIMTFAFRPSPTDRNLGQSRSRAKRQQSKKVCDVD